MKLFNQSKERSVNSMRNAFFSLLMFLLSLVAAFIKQSVFLRYLSVDYQGISSTLSSILSFLSLTELGIGGAISFALYEPLLKQNTPKVNALMKLYHKCYIVVGTVILAFGMMIMPFLSFFLKEIPNGIPLSSIRIFFLVFLIDTAVAYYLSYKRILIICDQREYISSLSVGISNVIMTLFSVIVLIKTSSFFCFLLVMLICNVLEYLFISSVSEQLYGSYLNYKGDENQTDNALPAEERKTIRKNVSALLLHHIGSIVVFSSDSLIISKFVGVTQTGLYANYVMVISNANRLFQRLFSSTSASIGNLIAEKDTEHAEKIFYHILFMSSWGYGWGAICLLCLTQPFIELWLGSKFLLDYEILIAAVISYYLTGVRTTVHQFKDAAGVFRQDMYKPLIESIVNIIVSIPLAIHYGIKGVLIGTIISTISVAFWFEALVTFKAIFNKGIGKYMFRQISYLLYNFVLVCITLSICHAIDSLEAGRYLSFIAKGLICVIVPNSIYYMCFRKTENLNYFKKTILSHLPKKKPVEKDTHNDSEN